MPPQQNIHIEVPWYLPAIVGGALVLAAIIGSYTFYAVRSLDNVLTVTGSTKTHVTADTAKWTIMVTRRVPTDSVTAGYTQVAHDVAQVQAFLKANAIPDDAVTTMPPTLDEVYNQYGAPQEYNIRENIMINSKDVTGIDALSKRMSEVSAKGVLVTGNYIEFYVSNLPELRVSLLGDAIKDAKARAVEIAKAGGQSVGALKAASSGVVQVLAPNSIDVSDYGQYDTQSIEKDVMVTVKATFFVR